jgi:hypothetical protein
VLRGARVVLRGWREDDLEPFAALNADPRVMEHFPSTPVLAARPDGRDPEGARCARPGFQARRSLKGH